MPLQWCHNERDGISNHRHLYCLLSHFFKCSSKKTSKLRVTGLCEGNPPVTGGQDSDQFISFNSIPIPIQAGFRIFQFSSIPIQIGFRIFQFNSNSIHFLSIPIQFNSDFMHRNKQINQIIGYFKFNLSISLFAAQFRKYIIQDHNNSRLNKSAFVQGLG